MVPVFGRESMKYRKWILAIVTAVSFTVIDAKADTPQREMYRMYNPNSGEHFYTSSRTERDSLISYGWKYEGTGWFSPESSEIPVYRLYNPNSGDHHYTMSEKEKNTLVDLGWNDEGIGWYSSESASIPVYRLYNSHQKTGNHHYTTSKAEYDVLNAGSWTGEGIAWYADKEGYEAVKSESAGSGSLPFYIRVNVAANTVNVYTHDNDGNYNIPLYAFVCSTGSATMHSGTYRLSNYTRWRSLFGGVYGQYGITISGDILFHSVPYYSKNVNDLEYQEYNKLGTAASMGCVRLCVRDVKWLYDYTTTGTLCEMYDDADNPGPLGKPSSIIIDVNSPNRGWDPTDPDPNNPWNQ